MDPKQFFLLLNVAFLLLNTSFGQTENTTKRHSPKFNVTGGYKDGNASTKSEISPSQEESQGQEVLDMYRVIPAGVTIMIFVVGSLFIFCHERKKEIKRRRAKENNDIDEDEDDELNSAWISNIAKRNKRKGTVIDKFRRMSIAVRGYENARDLEKERKYKIYDDMLEKYRETLRVLRKGTKPQVSNADRPATRIKKLAEMHKQMTNDTQMSEESGGTDKIPQAPADQYSLVLEALSKEAEDVPMSADELHKEPIEEESDTQSEVLDESKQDDIDTEEPEEIDPVYLTRRRRSSRFRKQAVIEEDGSFDRPSLAKAGALFQSYMASQEDFDIPQADTSAEVDVVEDKNDDEDKEIIQVLEKSSEAEISALHRIQQRMRPKSFIETLAAIHRESISLSSPHAMSMTSLSKGGSKSNLTKEVKMKPAVKSVENVATDENNTTERSSPTLRGKEETRRRPKSLYETGANKRRKSQTRMPRARPASLYIQHRIQDAIPETQREIPIDIEPAMPSKGSKSSSQKYLEFGSLQDLPFHAMTADEEENVIAAIEKQLIAQVCDENDLSNDELKALESLLDDVVTYSKQDPAGAKPRVEKQYSFTDSVSLFGDMEHGVLEEADENEEAVLLSLKDVSIPSSSKRLSCSAYDNV